MKPTVLHPASAQTIQPEAKKQLTLNGHTVIQYCTSTPKTGSWYTEDTQLLFVKKGSLKLRYGKENYEIGANKLMLLKKNIWVEYPCSAAGYVDSSEYVQFTIKSDLVKDFTKLTELSPVKQEEHSSVLIKDGPPSWLLYVNSLEPYLTKNCTAEPGLVKLKMLELLFHLSSMDKCLLEQIMDVREHYRINITATVENNIMNSMSMGQLAALSGRSLSSFRRDFAAIYNMPPSQWIRLKRLDKARELLLSTTMTITDICYTLGFENIAHFSRLFKSHFGFPPSDYKVNFLVA